jgi:hypothetical protein
MLTGGAVGFDVATIGTIWALSHLVGAGEVADVGLVAYNGHRAFRAYEAAAAMFEVADGEGAASIVGVSMVSGGGLGFAAGTIAGLAATRPVCSSMGGAQ